MEEECALCGGEMVEDDVEEDREKKLRSRMPDLDDDENVHALVCQDCGHVAYLRS